MTFKRDYVKAEHAKARLEVADLTDKVHDTALGKKLAKAQSKLDFWAEQLGLLPAETPATDSPEATRATARQTNVTPLPSGPAQAVALASRLVENDGVDLERDMPDCLRR